MRAGVRIRRFGPLALAALAGLGLGLGVRPYALAVFHTAQGMAALDEALRPVFPDRLAPEQILDPGRLAQGVAHLQAALAWDPRHRAARRGLARAYAAQNRPDLALEALRPALVAFPNDPLLWLEWGDLQDMRGDAEAAVEAYERGRVGNRAAPLIANYFKLADAQVAQGSGELAIRFWQRVLALDPGNLAARYRLWRAGRALGDMAAAVEQTAWLRRFPAGSVRVPVDLDFRLPRAQGETMARLVEEGIWDAATLHRVVGAQAARFADGLEGRMTEQLLSALEGRRPLDPRIRFAQAEVRHRRGEWEAAAALYRAVLEEDPEDPRGALRLGMVAEARAAAGSPEALQEAAAWYRAYRDRVPLDLLGLRRWVEACEALARQGGAAAACAGSGVGRRELEDRMEDRALVARLLGVPVERLILGPNLVENGGFEAWAEGQPVGWSWSDMSNRPPWDPGLFLGGVEALDAYAGRRAARVDGLWVAREEGREAARAGYWAAKVPLRPGALYLLSFAYRSDLAPGAWVGVWVSDRPEVLFAGDRWLPDTGGAWRRAVLLGWNRAADGTIAVLLRLWGEGTVLFDEVAVREVQGANAAALEALSFPILVLR